MLATSEIIDLTHSSPLSSPSKDTAVQLTPGSQKRKHVVDGVEDGGLPETATTSKTFKQHHRSRPRSTERDTARAVSRRERRLCEHRTRSRDRDLPPSRRRSHSPKHHHSHSHLSLDVQSNETSPLFFIDTKLVLVTDKSAPKESPSNQVDPAASDLLLPAHVTVLGSGVIPIKIRSPTNSDQEENENDYINYLDYDDDRRAGIIRYFDEATTESKTTKFVCKHCGAEGDHKTRECPVQICLTCGARDEHSTRSCPIGKTCFTCGMKGHINKTCPNRYEKNDSRFHDDCDRCGSRSHYTNECPTLWRMYEFVTDQERDNILRAREEKKDIPLGQGGEGYIAGDDWCYNCGDCGHLGDDCRMIPHQPDFPREPSAFSELNTRSGPFFDPTAEPSKKKRSRARRTRDWEIESEWADGHRSQPPSDIGKQGKKKERARMEKIAREQVDEDDPDDWFRNPKNAKSRGMPSAGRGKGKVELKFKDGGKRFGGGAPPVETQSSAPSLLARLGDRYESRDPPSSHSTHKYRRKRERTGDYHSRDRDDHGSRSRDRYNSRDRPRYNGDYT